MSAPVNAQASNWGAVFAMALCAAILVASEFLPVGLLTPLAHDLRMSEGQAGRAITVSGFFAVLTSLGISPLTRGLDRRVLLLFLVGLMVVGDVVVVFAANAEVFMLGRACIGVVVGGFWSMSVATVMRLVSSADVPKGLAIMNGGNALASALALALASFLGQYIGWRGAIFVLLVPLGVLALVWLLLRLPPMPSARNTDAIAVFRILQQRPVWVGMLAVAVFFLGQFALSTYLRPFLETVTRVNTTTLSLVQLAMGGMGFLGNICIGILLRTRLYSLLVVVPVLMATIALALTLLGHVSVVAGVLLALWGFVATAVPAAWWTWLSKALPHNAEAGGGLLVAVIQLAITSGATIGGALYDQSGYRASFTFSAVVLCVAACLAVLMWRTKRV